MSLGQVKFKKHMKELKNRQRSDFQSKEPSTFTFFNTYVHIFHLYILHKFEFFFISLFLFLSVNFNMYSSKKGKIKD